MSRSEADMFGQLCDAARRVISELEAVLADVASARDAGWQEVTRTKQALFAARARVRQLEARVRELEGA